jgi:hypothetical protein
MRNRLIFPDTHCCSTIRNAEQSPLLKLPAELRTKIYTFVFSGLHRDFLYFADYPSKICKPEDFTSAPSNKLARKELASAISLLQTCKQVHYETALLPFQIFEFRIKHVKLFNIFVRQNITEHQRSAIQTVRFYTDFLEEYVSQRGRSGEHISDCALLALAQLAGLERVIWEYSVSRGGDPSLYPKDRLETLLRLLGGRPELDVVIYEGP